MDVRTKTLAKNTAILSFGNICTKGVMFFMTPLFTRWVSQSDYGTFDLLVTYISLLLPLVTLDIGEGVFRFLVGNQADFDKKSIISIAVITNAFMMLISLTITVALALIFRNFCVHILLYFLMLFSEVLYTFFTVVSRGLRQMHIFARGNIIYVFSMAALSFVFVKMFQWGLDGLLISYALGYLICSAYMAIKSKIWSYFAVESWDWNLFKIMCRYSLPMIPNAIAWWVVNVSDRTLISFYMGTSENAVLAIANKLPNLCQQLFKQFHLSWQETAVDALYSNDRDVYYSKVFNGLLRIMCSLIIVIVGANFLFYKILFTEEYSLGYYLTPILLLAIMVYMMTQFLGGIYIAKMDSVKNGKSTVIASVINLAIDILLIPYIGLGAAVLSTLISYISLFIIRYKDISKTITLKLTRNSMILLGVLIYYVGVAFLNKLVLNIVNLVAAVVLFVVINYDIVQDVLNKVRKKKNKN